MNIEIDLQDLRWYIVSRSIDTVDRSVFYEVQDMDNEFKGVGEYIAGELQEVTQIEKLAYTRAYSDEII